MTKLPGTPRDLPTIEAHLERVERWRMKLWKYDSMKLKHCSNTYNYDEADELLKHIRHDVGAIVSSLHALKRELENASDRTDTNRTS